MKNKWYPLNNNRFIVSFGGREIGFTRISGVELTNQYAVSDEMMRTGKKNVTHEVINGYTDDDDEQHSRHYHKKESRNTVTMEKALKPVLTDADQAFLLDLVKKNVLIECISVRLLRNDGSQAGTLNFLNCTLQSFSISDLDASSTGYIKQTLQFKYREVELSAT